MAAPTPGTSRPASRRARSCSGGRAKRCRSPRRSPAGCASRTAPRARCSSAWPSAGPPRAEHGTHPAASRLAARLQARGLDAVARGRLAWLALPADQLALAARAAAAVDVPAVIAVTGPRTPATDELLAEQDLVVLVVGSDAQPGLEALALAGLAGCAAPVVVHRPLDSPGARPAAMAG